MLRRRKQPLRRIVVYAIVSQLDKRLYVGQCSEASLTAVYRHHINGKYEATAQLFADSVAARKMPRSRSTRATPTSPGSSSMPT